MPAAGSFDLFELINSLSKAEKAFFKLNCRIETNVESGGPVYIKLFDLVAGQNKFEESQILSELSISRERLPKIKNYLYNCILESLELYHSNKLIGTELKHNLFRIDVLIEKGLLNQSEKLLSKTKAACYEQEEFETLLELTRLQKKILLKRSYSSPGTNLKKIIKEEEGILSQLKNISYFENVEKGIMENITKSGVSRDQKRGQIKKLIPVPAVKPISFKAKISYCNAMAMSCVIKNRHAESCIYFEEKVRLMKNNSGYLILYPVPYSNALHNLASAAVISRKWKLAEKCITEIRKIPSVLKKQTDVETEYNIFSNSIVAELYLYSKTGNIEKSRTALAHAEKEMIRYKIPNHTQKISLYFNMATNYFLCANLSAALKWLNRLLHETSVEVREDIHVAARMLLIIIYFELNEIDILESQIRSFYRFLLRKKRLHKFESTIIKFIRHKLQKVNSNNQLLKVLTELRDELKLLTKYPEENIAIEYFDYISWLGSKI